MNEGLANSFWQPKTWKYAFQAQIDIGLNKIGTFLYWIIRYEYKGIYKKWFGVLIWYWITELLD
jgi:hypothetical protein